MNTKQQIEFDTWICRLSSGESIQLSLWQEAMTQLRQLHGDIWNGVMFFSTVNGVLIAAIFTILTEDIDLWPGILASSLASIGIIITSLGLTIFINHRRYYVQMLLCKTLLEKKLGFYDVLISKTSDQNLVFPWKVDKQFVNRLVRDPKGWIKEHKFRERTNSRYLLYVYFLFLILYSIFFYVPLLVALVTHILELVQ